MAYNWFGGYYVPIEINPDFINLDNAEKIGRALDKVRPDLVISRRIQFPEEFIRAAEDRGIRAVLYDTETGPGKTMDLTWAWAFQNVIVPTKADRDRYRALGIENVYYLPFCCLPSIHKPVKPDPEFRADIIAYGDPVYHKYPEKKACIDSLVQPLMGRDYNLAIWGLLDDPGGGWNVVPGFDHPRHYRGIFRYQDFATVHSSCKIMLGLTANAPYGAYPTKLSRGLACGTFILWYYTEGMEEYFTNHQELCWSRSPEETVELVDYYLKHEDERKKIAERGQQYAYENLNYTKRFPRLLERIDADYTGLRSRVGTKVVQVESLYEKGELDRAEEMGEKLLEEFPKLKPHLVRVRFLLATILLRTGRLVAAEKAYGHILADYPTLVEALNAVGDVEGARIWLSRAETATPRFMDTRYNRALLELNPEGCINLKYTPRLRRS
jgi:hypothetical protein